ncbi:uncharacterized protein MONBRDRAFT_7724 [Monosiga brevicollis MX1]|uniref:Fungal lipase-like domain-containing protein n=1 Tax=Monosiga brevicollis TaxID=81824 RepID=A9UY44_MONBE|nr:uncharacterized protein MONBRDRAFT_7724 [Monosiga brevicollis MX1]EDQ89797.1 predicted protein [Monosiga brevicollis MX1]|eukprot:XP_001745219.1 hypothetical protein [Monosiga brevicollis MX1]
MAMTARWCVWVVAASLVLPSWNADVMADVADPDDDVALVTPQGTYCNYPHRCVGSRCRFDRTNLNAYYPPQCTDCRCIKVPEHPIKPALPSSLIDMRGAPYCDYSTSERYVNKNKYTFTFTVSTGHSGTGFFGQKAMWAHALNMNKSDTPVAVGHEYHPRRYFLAGLQYRSNMCEAAWTFAVEELVPFIESELRDKNSTAYYASGHDLTMGTMHALLTYLGSAARLVRLRRSRRATAQSFYMSAHNGPQSNACIFCVKPYSPLSRCPLRDRAVFKNLTPFQAYLALVDENECQWQSYLFAYPRLPHLTINWSGKLTSDHVVGLAKFVLNIDPNPRENDVNASAVQINHHAGVKKRAALDQKHLDLEYAQYTRILGLSPKDCNEYTCVPMLD